MAEVLLLKGLIAEAKATRLSAFSVENDATLSKVKLERVRGVEPLSTGWKPVVMPLYDTRRIK